MRVRDIKNEELRKRVEGEQAFICQREFAPDNLSAELLNKVGLPPGDGFIMLPRDRTIEIGASIEDKEDMVLPSTVLEHLIRNASHRVIIQFCLCRDGMGCKDYPMDWGSIFMGDAAKGIDPEQGRAVSVEEALEYAAKCREAGLVHIVGRFSGDLRWLNPGVGPIEKLITVCNCCPCCCGMRSVPILKDDLREQTLARMPGVNIEVSDDCVGCGECVEQCMFQGVEMKDDMAVINERCRLCGRCIDVCTSEAIKINVKSADYVEKAMILSVPEGDDKVLKYPLMFSVCDALVVNKIDYLPMTDFDMLSFKERVRNINPEIAVFETSCRTGEGLDEWCRWLASVVAAGHEKI